MNNPTVEIHVDHNHIELFKPYKPDDLCKFTIPAGFVSDGASIPRWLWSTIGSPFHPKFIPAALYHDYELSLHWSVAVPRSSAVYSSARKDRKRAIDKEFRRLLLANGVSKSRAGLMYRAVRWFGKRR